MVVANVVDGAAYGARDNVPRAIAARRRAALEDLHAGNTEQGFRPLGLLVRNVEDDVDVMPARRQSANRRVEVPQIARVLHHEEKPSRSFRHRYCGRRSAMDPERPLTTSTSGRPALAIF